MPKYTTEQTNECRTRLLKLLPPGSTITCILRHVAKSGMSRVVSLAVAAPTGLDDDSWEVRDISWEAAVVTESPRCPKTGGVKISGVGMDMGFAIVGDLAWKLYGTGKRASEAGDAGYTLRHRWL